MWRTFDSPSHRSQQHPPGYAIQACANSVILDLLIPGMEVAQSAGQRPSSTAPLRRTAQRGNPKEHPATAQHLQEPVSTSERAVLAPSRQHHSQPDYTRRAYELARLRRQFPTAACRTSRFASGADLDTWEAIGGASWRAACPHACMLGAHACMEPAWRLTTWAFVDPHAECSSKLTHPAPRLGFVA